MLRIVLAVVLLTHSIPGIFNNGINDFGNLYLNEKGFAPFGLYIAWAIKMSHIVCAILFLISKYIKPAAVVTIFILIAGIVMVHAPDGWYVVGPGRNGAEYNFVLIAILLTLMFPQGIAFPDRTKEPINKTE